MPPANLSGQQVPELARVAQFPRRRAIGCRTPSVINAVKASQAWLSGGAAKTYSWLLVNGSLVAGARKTLGDSNTRCTESRAESPTRVSPEAAARLTARLEGAPMAASTLTPARSAFCTSSKLARPLNNTR